MRGLVVLLLDWAALLLLGALLSGFDVHGPAGALVTAVIAAALNALVWPTLSRLALPAQRAHPRRRGARAQRRPRGARGRDQPGRQHRRLVRGRGGRGRARRSSPRRPPRCWPSTTTTPGSATSCAARRGAPGRSRRTSPAWCSSRSTAWPTRSCGVRCATATRPSMARWLREGTHRLERWETDWSSQTGACQAGLLHGDNDDMPAFRWWEKDRGRAIVTNHPRDAAGARTPPLRRARAAARGRRQPGEHPLGRRRRTRCSP